MSTMMVGGWLEIDFVLPALIVTNYMVQATMMLEMRSIY